MIWVILRMFFCLDEATLLFKRSALGVTFQRMFLHVG